MNDDDLIEEELDATVEERERAEWQAYYQTAEEAGEAARELDEFFL